MTQLSTKTDQKKKIKHKHHYSTHYMQQHKLLNKSE